MAEVLRGRADHGRPPDVDHFDDLVEPDAGHRRCLLERIEVAHDEVDRLEPGAPDVLHVLVIVANGHDPRVDLRVERLHPSVEHLGKSRIARDPVDLYPVVEQKARGPARREDLDSHPRELAGELDDAVLVVDGDERAGNRPERSRRDGAPPGARRRAAAEGLRRDPRLRFARRERHRAEARSPGRPHGGVALSRGGGLGRRGGGAPARRLPDRLSFHGRAPRTPDPRYGVPERSPFARFHTLIHTVATSLTAWEYASEAMANGTERSSKSDGLTAPPWAGW